MAGAGAGACMISKVYLYTTRRAAIPIYTIVESDGDTTRRAFA